LSSESIVEGSIIEKGSSPRLGAFWPEEIDAFVAVNYHFSHAPDNIDADAEVMLLMMVPIRYPKSGAPSRAKLEAWIAKQRLSSWKAVSLKSAW
jgi:hypothetical protein